MRNDVLRYGMLAVVVALLAAGCDRGLTLSEQEALERSTSLYKNAIDDFQAGRVDAAIKGFERVVFYEPKSYSAHFQLATLLQDVRKDYISAIAHYRDYLAHRPASDKATVALDRVKACETMLQAEMVRKAGGSASSKIAADNERLTAECDDLKKKVARLEGDLEKARRTISRLQGEAERRSQLLAKLGESFEGKVTKDAAMKDALAQLKEEKDEIRRRRLQPTDAELLDEEDDVSAADARKTADLKEAKKLAQLDDDVPARPTASTPCSGARRRRAPRPPGPRRTRFRKATRCSRSRRVSTALLTSGVRSRTPTARSSPRTGAFASAWSSAFPDRSPCPPFTQPS